MQKLMTNKSSVAVVAIVMSIAAIAFIMWAIPVYNVWAKQQSGKAQLAEAEFNRRIAIREAEANLESQKLNAQAEVERAKGAAQAMEIEDGKLSDRYIRYLYVQNLDKLDTNLIYVPTEGGLPLLEANRLDQ